MAAYNKYFNWGTGIAVVFILGALGIFYLVKKSMDTTFDMVTPNYYAAELQYNQTQQAASNGDSVKQFIVFSQTADSFLIQSNNSAVLNNADSGQVYLYRPSDARFDRKTPLHLNASNRQAISKKGLASGQYIFKLLWKNNHVDYFINETIFIH